jgi:high-affinity iron transporter
VTPAVWLLAGFTAMAVIAGIAVVAQSGSPDPTEATVQQAHAVVVVNSAVIVFREGLEAILIFAAVTAALLGAQSRLRRPVAVGAAVAFAATVATWFVAQAILAQFSAYEDELLALTGLLAIVVLLVIMNWFFHKLYWTRWIAKRNDQRRRALARSAERGLLSGQVAGLVLLGFSSVYREGFEVVLFLQNLQLRAGTATVLEGVAIGLAGTAAVGIVTFFLAQKLPYRRLLVTTGVMLGAVLVVMVGGSARTLQDLGWIPTTPLGVGFPDWLARWFEVVPTYETLTAQALAVILVLGSYLAARHVKVVRPRSRGEQPAFRPDAPPSF